MSNRELYCGGGEPYPAHPTMPSRGFSNTQDGKRLYKGRLECTLCGASTIRMDIHLKKVHKLEKGTRPYQRKLNPTWNRTG